jgi:hypothetical protein
MHNRSLKVAVQGPDLMAHPSYTYTYIQDRLSHVHRDLWCVSFIARRVSRADSDPNSAKNYSSFVSVQANPVNQWPNFGKELPVTRSRDSAVGMATGYGLDDWEVGVRVHVGSRIFSSPRHPDRLWVPPSFLSSEYRVLFPRGKAAEAWSWPLTSNKCRGQENVDLYIHSPIRLHGVMLN